MLERGVPIINSEAVVQQVRRKEDIEVTISQVKTIMKDELGLGYRVAKKVPIQANMERCLVLRQQYATEMLSLLQRGAHILNVDESWVSSTNFTRMLWAPSQTPATMRAKPISYRISLIAALDTEGNIYYSLTQANTDQNVMMVFLIHLVEQLDLARPSWKDDTVLLLDGARYHTGSKVREYLRKLELQVIWSGPYSYSTAPIEMVFAALKFGELNPDGKSTGKKALDKVAYMIGAKL